MNLTTLFRGCVLALLVGMLFKINHWQGADWLLLLGFAASLVVVVVALIEIGRSRSITGGEKVLWMTIVLLGNELGLLLYIVVGRKRVLAGG